MTSQSMHHSSWLVWFLSISLINSQDFTASQRCDRIGMITSYVSEEVLVLGRLSSGVAVCCIKQASLVGWYRGKQLVQNSSKYVIFSLPGVSILRINNITTNDAGKYACIVNENGGEKRELYVSLVLRAGISYYKRDQFLQLTGSPTVDIDIFGLPFPDVQWFKDGESLPFISLVGNRTSTRSPRYILNAKGQLTFLDSTLNDSGSYSLILKQSEYSISERTTFQIYMGAKPFITRFPASEYIFTIGQNKTIPCTFTGIEKSVTWFFRPVNSTTERRIERDLDSRYRVEVDGPLEVIGITENDLGTYKCVCKNFFGQVSASTQVVRVIQRAKIFRLNDVIAMPGNDVDLICDVSGTPPITIDWWHNGLPVDSVYNGPFKKILRIKNTRNIDAGKYTCTASNNASNGDVTFIERGEMTLFVSGIPSIDLLLTTRSVAVTENKRQVELVCVANGYPTSDITFTFNNKLVGTADILESVFEGGVKVVFTLTYSDDNQLGIYTCKARNYFGTDSKNMLVYRVNPPLPPTIFEILENQPNYFIICWRHPDSTSLNAEYWLKDSGVESINVKYGEKQTFATNIVALSFEIIVYSNEDKSFFYSTEVFVPTIRIQNVRKLTTYNIVIRSKNQAGWSQTSKTFIVSTPRVGNPPPPRILSTISVLSGIDFVLEWEAPYMAIGEELPLRYDIKICLLSERSQTTEYIDNDLPITDSPRNEESCENMTGIYSTKQEVAGLLSHSRYRFYVSSVNYHGRSPFVYVDVITGINPDIGARASKLTGTQISAIIICCIIFLLILIDFGFCCLGNFGILYCFYTICCLRDFEGNNTRIVGRNISARRSVAYQPLINRKKPTASVNVPNLTNELSSSEEDISLPTQYNFRKAEAGSKEFNSKIMRRADSIDDDDDDFNPVLSRSRKDNSQTSASSGTVSSLLSKMKQSGNSFLSNREQKRSSTSSKTASSSTMPVTTPEQIDDAQSGEVFYQNNQSQNRGKLIVSDDIVMDENQNKSQWI